MPRRTLWIPDELDAQVTEDLEYGDSYSGVVQDALEQYLDAQGVDA